MAALHRELRIISKEPVEGLWFKHESPYDVDMISPISYQLLAERKGGAFALMRKMYDERYRQYIKHHPDYTFLHATVVGGNKMEDPTLYEGFTYYFQLPEAKIEKALFTIIDREELMVPTPGLVGLQTAIDLWDHLLPTLSAPSVAGVIKIYPRIEVLLPFAVEPTLVVPQIEDR